MEDRESRSAPPASFAVEPGQAPRAGSADAGSVSHLAAARSLTTRVLSGRSSQPRVRGGVLVTLVLALAILGVTKGISMWHSHEQADLLASYNRTTAAVSRMTFPPEIKKFPCRGTGANACGYSTLTPAQLIPALRQFTNGGKLRAVPGGLRCIRTIWSCPATVAGHFHGFQLVAIAFWHLLSSAHGRPPHGAVLLRRGRFGDYFRGSNIAVVVVTPPSLSNSD